MSKGKIVDLSSRDIYQPLSVKNQVINSGTEAACMILPIHDIISAGAPKGAPSPSPGGGYAGMPE
jgi:chaperonin GroEL (HSP60 family)